MGASVQPDPVADYLAAKQAVGGKAPVDPVADYLSAKAAAKPSGPGFVQRGLSMLANAAEHPLETLGNAISAPVKSAVDIVAPSPAGAAAYNNNPVAQARNLARYGEYMNVTGVTPQQRLTGAVQTAANLAMPEVGGKITEAVSPYLAKPLAWLAGKAITGAGIGAAYNPHDPAAGMVAGAIAGPTVDAAAKGAGALGSNAAILNRASIAAPLDETVVNTNIANKAANQQNYGQAEAEGQANGGTSPAVAQALQHPAVAPYANIIKKTIAGQNYNDAELAKATDQAMTRARKGLQTKQATNYDPVVDGQLMDIRAGQGILRAATGAASQKPPITLDVAGETTESPTATVETSPMKVETAPAQDVAPLMPSYMPAVQARAQMGALSDAYATAADRARAVIAGKSLAAKNLGTKSGAAWLQEINQLSPELAQRQIAAVLGRVKENQGLPAITPQSTLFGTLGLFEKPLSAANRVRPFLTALDAQANGPPAIPPGSMSALMSRLGLAGAAANFSPSQQP